MPWLVNIKNKVHPLLRIVNYLNVQLNEPISSKMYINYNYIYIYYTSLKASLSKKNSRTALKLYTRGSHWIRANILVPTQPYSIQLDRKQKCNSVLGTFRLPRSEKFCIGNESRSNQSMDILGKRHLSTGVQTRIGFYPCLDTDGKAGYL